MFLFMQQCGDLKIHDLRYNLAGKTRLMRINVHGKYQRGDRVMLRRIIVQGRFHEEVDFE